MGRIEKIEFDDGTMERLRHQAELNGRTVEGELQSIVAKALPPSATYLRESIEELKAGKIDFKEMAARMRSATAGRHHTPSQVLLREDRDTR